LAYADDIVVIGNIRDEVLVSTADSIKAAKAMGMEINQDFPVLENGVYRYLNIIYSTRKRLE